jgi:peptide/nickel transport system substrate-binding protein
MTKKNIIIGILILLALVGFIEKDYLMNDLPRMIFGSHNYKKETLRIVMNTPATDLSEYSFDLNNLIRTANIFEGLVTFDRNLKIIPALAVSWGNTDDVTWEFKLRKGVIFHDGSKFNAQSVLDSLQQMQSDPQNQSAGILSAIKDIKIIDDYTIKVTLKEPDPLILSRLTKFFISRPNHIGTGPYRITASDDDNLLSLTAFPDYWGKQPAYKNVDYAVTTDKQQRETDFQKGLTDILVAVPKEQAMDLPKDQIKTSYSLEVNFLMFNLTDPIFADRSVRAAIQTIFDPAKIEDIGNNFVRQVSQFVAPGVFGYNPNIPMFKFSEEARSKNLFGEQRKKITLDFLSTFRTLAEYLQKQLLDAGFLVELNEISPEALLDKIRNNSSQMFLIGWQAENGDAGDFLDSFIHSQGEFNNGRYQNAVVDKLIEKSRQELDPKIRLATLQKIMELVDKDIIGIPLFESSRIYAVKKGVQWEPRLDGLVLASDVK